MGGANHSTTPLLWWSTILRQLRFHHGAEHFTSTSVADCTWWCYYTLVLLSPSLGISTSCTESRPPPIQLCHFSLSLRCFTWKSTTFVVTRCFTRKSTFGSTSHSFITGASLRSPSSTLYEQFVVTGASLGGPPLALHEPHLSLLEKEPISEVFHSETLVLLRTVHSAFTVRSVHGSSWAICQSRKNTSFDCCILNLPNWCIEAPTLTVLMSIAHLHWHFNMG